MRKAPGFAPRPRPGCAGQARRLPASRYARPSVSAVAGPARERSGRALSPCRPAVATCTCIITRGVVPRRAGAPAGTIAGPDSLPSR